VGTSLLELARHMGVTASTMSLMADPLERGGYVRRDRSNQDGGRVDLRLTAAGELIASGEMSRILQGGAA
jgi:DNA-binding MarR family transcriptional regulator